MTLIEIPGQATVVPCEGRDVTVGKGGLVVAGGGEPVTEAAWEAFEPVDAG